MVEVTGGEVGMIGEHDADAVDASHGQRVVVRSPRARVGHRRIAAAARR